MTTRHAVFDAEGDLVEGRPNRLVQAGGVEPRPTIAALTKLLPLSKPLAAGAARNQDIGEVDPAVAALEPDIRFDPQPISEPLVRLRTIGMPEPGAQVFKVGSATGLTKGKVISVDHEVHVQIGGRPYWFAGAALVKGDGEGPFASPGDAGAVIVDRAGEVMGMLFAGAADLAYAFPLKGALERLGYTLFSTDDPVELFRRNRPATRSPCGRRRR